MVFLVLQDLFQVRFAFFEQRLEFLDLWVFHNSGNDNLDGEVSGDYASYEHAYCKLSESHEPLDHLFFNAQSVGFSCRLRVSCSFLLVNFLIHVLPYEKAEAKMEGLHATE